MRAKITLNGDNFFKLCCRENPITEMDSPQKIDNDSCPKKSIFDDYFGPNWLEKKVFYPHRQ